MENQMEPQNQSKNQEKITLESLYALLRKGEEDAQKRLAEFDRRLKKMEEDNQKRSKESDRHFKKREEDAQKRSEKFDRESEKSREEFDQRMKESSERFDRDLKKSREEFDKKFDKMVIEIGGIGNSNGNVAEKYFQTAFQKNPALNGQKYDTVNLNMYTNNKKLGLEGEYDIVLLNEESVAIIEAKYHLKMNHYFKNGAMKDEFKKILNKIETFKTLYPVYKDHKFYLGIAALSFEKEIEARIIKEGIAVIKQVGDKMVINSENLKEF